MAKSTTTTVILLLTIIAALFAITTTARPCKTIFFITTTTSSTTFNNNPNQNPQNPNHLTFFITEIHQFHRHQHHRPIFPDQFPQSHVKSVDSSVKDRTIDIMSIVGSLLFGVGCGAFTAAVMYSIWYFCSDRTHSHDDEDFDSDEEDFDDVEAHGEYVAVANADKEVPPTADEVDAMKK